MQKDGTLYWITGLSGAGKTTIGNYLYYELRKKQNNVVILDGDILKNIVNDTPGYGIEDRRKRAMKYAFLCKALTDQGLVVICCTIAMFDEVREWNRKNNKGYVEVFINTPLKVLEERNQRGMYSRYSEGKFNNLAGIDIEIEWPKSPDVEIINDGTESISNLVDKILSYNVVLSTDYKRDTEYWNDYYKKELGNLKPSEFAIEVGKYVESKKSILELGCGNGRDSLYFDKLGLRVTAIDASNVSIDKLRQLNSDIWFVCDDFVCSTIIKTTQYDYVYSRFTLHAINEHQENELLKNAYNALKASGIFFIETRSIHDDLYGKGKEVEKNAFIYNNHYRRFIDIDELTNKLEAIGFKTNYAEENVGFAPNNGDNPKIIRIICTK